MGWPVRFQRSSQWNTPQVARPNTNCNKKSTTILKKLKNKIITHLSELRKKLRSILTSRVIWYWLQNCIHFSLWFWKMKQGYIPQMESSWETCKLVCQENFPLRMRPWQFKKRFCTSKSVNLKHRGVSPSGTPLENNSAQLNNLAKRHN